VTQIVPSHRLGLGTIGGYVSETRPFASTAQCAVLEVIDARYGLARTAVCDDASKSLLAFVKGNELGSSAVAAINDHETPSKRLQSV